MRKRSLAIIVALLLTFSIYGFVDGTNVTNGIVNIEGCIDGCTGGTSPEFNSEKMSISGEHTDTEPYTNGLVILLSPDPYFPDNSIHISKDYTPTGSLYSYLLGVDVTNGGGAGKVYYTIHGDYFSLKSKIFWMEPDETLAIWVQLCNSVPCNIPPQNVYYEVRAAQPGDTNIGTFVITEPPNWGLSGTPTTGPAPLTVKFKDISAGDWTSWSWDFGDGSNSTLQNPTHTYAEPGKYSVHLWVRSDTESITYTRNDYITVNSGTSTITVTNPNNGENWKQGTIHTINWTYTGDPGSAVKIQLLKAGAVNRLITSSTPIGVGGGGYYNWKVPYNQALGSDYKIRVISTSDATMKDASDTYFTISAGTPITVTVPNGGESWKRGTTQTIKWKYTGSPGSNVKIQLLKSGVVNKVISASTPIGSGGVGSYKWSIAVSQVPGTDYKVRIISTSDSTKKDSSNNVFTIKI